MKIGNGNYVYPTHGKISKVLTVKYHSNEKIKRGIVYLNNITFPQHLIGRRIRVKIEFVEDDENE